MGSGGSGVGSNQGVGSNLVPSASQGTSQGANQGVGGNLAQSTSSPPGTTLNSNPITAGQNIPGNVWNNASGQTPLWASNPLAAGSGVNPPMPPGGSFNDWATQYVGANTPQPPVTAPNVPGTPWHQQYAANPAPTSPPPQSGMSGSGFNYPGDTGMPWQVIGYPGDPNTPGWNGPPAIEVGGQNVPLNTNMSLIGTGPGLTAPNNLPPWGLPAYGPYNPAGYHALYNPGNSGALNPGAGNRGKQLITAPSGAPMYQNTEGPGTGVNSGANFAAQNSPAAQAARAARNNPGISQQALQDYQNATGTPYNGPWPGTPSAPNGTAGMPGAAPAAAVGSQPGPGDTPTSSPPGTIANQGPLDRARNQGPLDQARNQGPLDQARS